MPPEAFALAPATTLSGNFQVFKAVQAGNAAAKPNQPAAQTATAATEPRASELVQQSRVGLVAA